MKLTTDENSRAEEARGNEVWGEIVRAANFVPRSACRGRHELILRSGGK